MNNYNYLKTKKLRELTELIIDISYNCNSKCRFCQWNIINSHETYLDLPLNQLLLSRENINSFNISRIVLSGGEPTLANNLLKIISYYKQFSLSIRLISNGISLTPKKVEKLSKLGIKEFVISINALDYDLYSMLHANTKKVFQRIIKNLKFLSNKHNNQSNIVLFLGLNVVLTRINCNWSTIYQFLTFSYKHNISQIKFQPVFDDGYLSKNAAELALGYENVEDLREIISNLKTYSFKDQFTNSLTFWRDLKKFLKGNELSPLKCAVCKNTILLHNGLLKFCFWCQHIEYGSLFKSYNHTKVLKIQKDFKENLNKCKVLPQCFCLQPINHSWS